VLNRIDSICDRFEAVWESGSRPKIEDFLGEPAHADREALLGELLAAEFDARRRLGEWPAPGEYHSRFPEAAAAIETAFGMLANPRGAKPAETSTTADVRVSLLFGLLGYQTGLISQSALAEGLGVWVKDKTRSLADLLSGAGGLDSSRMTLLDGLVVEHLKLYDGDVEKSLASLPAGESTRQRLTKLDDTELNAIMARVGTGPRSTELAREDFHRSASHTNGSASTDGPRFRVLRPHAKGGLGAVSVALDQELNREVALKQIVEHHADDPVSRSRFLLEAEITGGLEHPGIVPVYGLGAYGDGRPFYAMRFIRGDSLKDTIAAFHAPGGPVVPPGVDAGSPTGGISRSGSAATAGPGSRDLGLRKLLRRFLDVCNAIDYAHSRGVLHRDLKPSNVIVGKHGETLVVDWGLAKVAGWVESRQDTDERPLSPSSASSTAATVPGSALGTPAYMSPEQATGDLDQLGPRSDVYSLGATLYCLLTGTAPFEGEDAASILKGVRAGRFRPPRALDPALDRALESICLKAMALQPEDRYGSARALADDIERWMADEPVAAWREPRAVRMGRWMRRHRSLVTGAAGLLLATTIGLAVGAVLLDWANARTERRRQDAELHYALARDAVDRFFIRVSDDRLLNEPRMEPLRKELLEMARDFYQKLVDQRGGDADSLAQLGRVSYRLYTIPSELGSLPEAVKTAEKAWSIFSRLAREHPEVEYHWAGLFQCLRDLGSYYQESVQAEQSLRSALGVLAQLSARRPRIAFLTNEEFDCAQALVEKDLGGLLFRTGRPEQAEAFLSRSTAIFTRLAAEHPTVSKYQSYLASCYAFPGWLYYGAIPKEENEATARKALAFWQRQSAEHPADRGFLAGVAAGHYLLGLYYSRVEQWQEAAAAIKRASEIRERLAADIPDGRFRYLAADVLGALGTCLAEAGQLEEGEALLKRSVKNVEAALNGRTPDLFQAKRLCEIQCALGRVLQSRGDVQGANGWFDRAEVKARGLLDTDPCRSDTRYALHQILLNRAEGLARQGRAGETIASLDRVAELEDDFTRDASRIARAAILGRMGDYRRAMAESSAAASTDSIPPGLLAYRLARVDAICSVAAGADVRIEPAARAALVERLGAQAVARLRLAWDAGFWNTDRITRMSQDQDLDALRLRRDFQLLMQDLTFPADPFAP
jgi:serine/threonine-protein kinase